MRSNSSNIAKTVKNSKFGKLIGKASRLLIQRLSWELRLTARYLSLGMQMRQWAAMWLICLMLLPMFVAPASGARVLSESDSIETVNQEFEPVNAPQTSWNRFSLNAKLTFESLFSKTAESNIYGIKINENSLEDEKTVTSKEEANKKEGKTPDSAVDPQKSKTLQQPEPSEANEAGNSTETEPQTEQLKNFEDDTNDIESDNAATSKSPEPQPLMLQAERPILDETNLPVLVSPQNNLGNPLGQSEAQSSMPTSVASIVERSGIGNFNFGFPVVALPGRGLDVSMGVSYNSQVWTKSGNQYIYNVDGNWMSPGFQMGYGYLDAYRDGTQPPSNFVLTDADGTRHILDYISGSASSYSYLYETNDGSFTRVEFERHQNGNLTNLRTTFSDGSKTYYSGPNSQNRYFPERIVDVHGNYITINYLANDEVGKISTITDTLGRVITFHYDSTSDQKLIAVSVPGYNNSPTPRQTIRFYYETLTLNTVNRFGGTITAPASVPVLKYVYMPGDKTGYRYDYSSYYGMIYKITKLHGMQVSTDDTSVMGSVINTSSYVEAATTRYNYPGTDVEPPAPTLNDVPKYNKRTDDWIGRTGPLPVTNYNFSEDTNTKTTQITAPDNTTTVTVTTKNPGQWDDGLVKETYVTSPGRTTPWAKVINKWQYGDITRGRKNPRIEKVENINEAGLSKATTFVYDGYNNQTSVSEHDYAPTGQVGTELRRTETIYHTSGQYNVYVYRNLIHLPLSVKRIVNNTVVARTDYEYDGQPLLSYGANLTQHDERYNPDTPDGQHCYEVCPGGYEDPAYPHICTVPRVTVCDPIPIFDASTNFRGNVTKITSFVDVNDNADPNASVNEMKYDVTGNVVQATMNCCNVQTLEYSTDYKYAYPTKVTKGTSVQLESEATYDLGTGLIRSKKDANQQTTTFEYEPDTLRQKKIIFPNGGYTETEYSDKLAATPSQLVPGFVLTTTTLEANKTVQSYSYFDGRGTTIRTATETPNDWSVAAVGYDSMGRAVKTYNPFYAASPTDQVPLSVKWTEIVDFDGFGRATRVKVQDGSYVEAFFNEAAVNFTNSDGLAKTGIVSRAMDQAGKERRQITDALGRIVRVDEPTSEGLGSAETPKQPSFYYFDGNDNLTRVVQKELGGATQERKYKYDSLSRLTHEKQVEATPTLDVNGDHGAPNPDNWTKVLKYDKFGRMTESIDARGVKTKYDLYDGLNRIKKITFTDGTPEIHYTYDQDRTGFFNKGLLTRVETIAAASNPQPNTPATATEFDYDSMGRVRQHRQIVGGQIYNLEYIYNLAGQITSEKYPSGKIVTTSYDAGGRLASINDQGRTYLSGLQFGSNGGALTEVTLGNGIQQSFKYNDRLQIDRMTWAKAGSVVQRYDYTFGQMNAQNELKNNGKLAQVDFYSGGNIANPTKQFTQKFDYDTVGRLKSETEFRGDNNQQSYKQTFDYDRFGNRYLKAVDNPSSQNPLLPTLIEADNINKEKNQLAANTGTTYDDTGNVTIDQKFRNLKYAYDANGRMYRATSLDDVNQSNSVYDADGQRVAQQINGIWKFFVYNAFGKMVAEYGGLPSTDEGGVKYIQQDIQGSTRAITSVSGAVKTRMDYAAFGEEISASVGQRTAEGYSSSDSLRQKYAQTERDEATGLDHTLWRKSENRAGRWTSPDPYNGSASTGDPQSFNRYSYVENKPTNFTDPSGLNMEGGSTTTCTRYHYTNLTGTISFWGSWTCVSNGGGGGGGGGGGTAQKEGKPGKRNNKNPGVNITKLKKNMSDCAKEVFGVEVNISKIVSATPNSNGRIDFKMPGKFEGTRSIYSAVNFTRAQLGQINGPGGNLHGFTFGSYYAGKNIIERNFGVMTYTDPLFYNFVARDAVDDPTYPLKALIGNMLDTQVHEFGHNLAQILIDNGTQDSEYWGREFENCVHREYSKP